MMSHAPASEALAVTDALFFRDMDRGAAERRVAATLAGCDDGELFLEYRESEAISLDDGRIRSASFDTMRGFGLRAVAGEAAGFAHSGEISEASLARAAGAVVAVRSGHNGAWAAAPAAAGPRLYSDQNPLLAMAFAQKTSLLMELDAYARARDPRVVQVSASIMGEWQAVQVMRADGVRVADLRPLVRLNVNVVVEQDGRRESGGTGLGGRFGYDRVLDAATWQGAADEALRQALLNLNAVPAPAGEMEVVLGPGWPGILLHEAIGHGLEGDFNRKGTSAFAGLLGKRIGSPGITVVDDGTLADRRGSLTVDDEGTPSGRTVMIEDGVLTGYHPGPAECAADGGEADGQWAAAEPRPCADAADDEHHHAGRTGCAGGDYSQREAGALCGEFWWGAGGYYQSGKFVFSGG